VIKGTNPKRPQVGQAAVLQMIRGKGVILALALVSLCFAQKDPGVRAGRSQQVGVAGTGRSVRYGPQHRAMRPHHLGVLDRYMLANRRSGRIVSRAGVAVTWTLLGTSSLLFLAMCFRAAGQGLDSPTPVMPRWAAGRPREIHHGSSGRLQVWRAERGSATLAAGGRLGGELV
jgi:hypothetical protein